MHATSHGYWTHRLARRARATHPGWAALGGVLPDLPAAGLTVGLRAAGRAWRVAGDEAFDARFEPLHRATHSALGAAGLALTAPTRSRRRAVAAGWAGHLLVDLVSHHADARPPAWPLSRRIWRSPVSHWEADHHAAAWNAVDALALASAAYREGRRARRIAAAGAAAVSVAGFWEALAGRPLDPRARCDRERADRRGECAGHRGGGPPAPLPAPAPIPMPGPQPRDDRVRNRIAPMQRREVRFLDADPDLLEGLDEGATAEARARGRAPAETVEPGEWVPKADEFGCASGFGLLMIEGFVVRRVALGERWCVELLGPGTLLQPWLDDGEYAVSPFEASFNVLERVEVAVLDGAVAKLLCEWPTVVRNLLTRGMQRSRYMAGHLTLTQFPRVEVRLHVLLWHLAERFGRVTRDGVVVRLPLSHELLGGMIGARRPTVTTAIGRLEEQELVTQRRRHEWLLRQQPEEVGPLAMGQDRAGGALSG